MRTIVASLVLALSALAPSALISSNAVMAMPDCNAGGASTLKVDSVKSSTESVSSSYVDLVRKGQQVYNTHLKGLSKKAARREFNRLTDYQQKAVKAYHTKKGSTTTFCSSSATVQTVSGATCTANGMILSATDAIGVKLWDYTQEIYFCYDGTQVYDASYSPNVHTYLIFWSAQPYMVQDEFPKDGGPSSYYRAHTQAHLNICIVAGNIGCVADYYPWIDMWGYSDGNKNTYWSY